MADAVAANPVAATATPAQSQPAQTPVGEAALSKLPEKLQNLTRPVVVTGTVAGETPEGLTRVRTAAGEVLLKAPVPLPADRPVTLQIPAGSPPAKAMVSAQLPNPAAAPPAPPQVNTQVNIAPLQTAVTTLLQQTTGATAMQPAQLPTVGALISAVVIAANPRPTATAAPATGGSGAAATTAPTGGGKGEAPTGKAAAEGEATPATDGAAGKASGAIRGGGASTHGQPVELGGDAAHRGTMLGPPPAPPTRKPDGQADPQQQQQQQQQTPTDNPKAGEPKTAAAKTDPQQPGKPGAPAPASPTPPTGQGAPPTQQPPRQPTPPGAGPQTATPAPQAGPTAQPTQLSGPAPQPAARQQPPPPTSPGGLIAARPAPPSVPSAQTPAPATPAPPPPSPANSQTPPQTPTSPPPPLQAGQTLAFRVLAAAPPPTSPPVAGAPGAPPQAPQPGPDGYDGPVMEGTVAGTTPQGKPILALRDGMLALNTDAKLPPGARLTLQLTDPAAIAAERPAPLDGALPDYLQGRDWSALKSVLAALRDIDPALVQHFLAAAMPQPNRKLGATLSFLISAMRGGDARGWLGGDATQALRERGKENLLLEVEREIRNTEKQTAEKLPDDWQGVTLPMYDQSGVNPMHIFIHPFPEPEKEDEKGEAAKGTRFLLDVELSRLGPLQLDGMVKPPRFDLILRSKTPLDAALRDELRSVFADCLGAVGYAGGVMFQSDLRAWVRLARAGSAGPAVSA